MQSALDVVISGRVQGVFFRDFVRTRAEALGIVGAAENLPNGTVRVRAEGEKSALDEFLSELEQGPPQARVESLTISRPPVTGAFTGFSVQ